MPITADKITDDGNAEIGLQAENGTLTEEQPVDEQEGMLQTESELWNTDTAELEEINSLCGTALTALEELPRYRRYRELRENGGLSVEEALYASNLGKLPRPYANETKADAFLSGEEADTRRGVDSKRSADNREHLSSSRNKGANGEVFTRADREELALWGIAATGAELERLWRNAGMRDMR